MEKNSDENNKTVVKKEDHSNPLRWLMNVLSTLWAENSGNLTQRFQGLVSQIFCKQEERKAEESTFWSKLCKKFCNKSEEAEAIRRFKNHSVSFKRSPKYPVLKVKYQAPMDAVEKKDTEIHSEFPPV